MFWRPLKSQIKNYKDISYLPQTWLESLVFLLYKDVCYTDLPTEVNKILPLVSLCDRLSPEGSAWLCSRVLTSCVCVCSLLTCLTLPHRECW